MTSSYKHNFIHWKGFLQYFSGACNFISSKNLKSMSYILQIKNWREEQPTFITSLAERMTELPIVAYDNNKLSHHQIECYGYCYKFSSFLSHSPALTFSRSFSFF